MKLRHSCIFAWLKYLVHCVLLYSLIATTTATSEYSFHVMKVTMHTLAALAHNKLERKRLLCWFF